MILVLAETYEQAVADFAYPSGLPPHEWKYVRDWKDVVGYSSRGSEVVELPGWERDPKKLDAYHQMRVRGLVS